MTQSDAEKVSQLVTVNTLIDQQHERLIMLRRERRGLIEQLVEPAGPYSCRRLSQLVGKTPTWASVTLSRKGEDHGE